MRVLYFTSVLLFTTTSNADNIDYSKISDAQSARHGKMLIRQLKIYGDPCAYFQIINPKDSWNVTETKIFCNLDGKSFWTDFADASVTNIMVSQDGITMNLSITPLTTTGEENKKCFIPISNQEFGDIECQSAETKDQP